MELFVDPVVASDGHTYERAAIEEVLLRHDRRSPLTRESLGPQLVPNIALRKCLADHDEELAAAVAWGR